MHDFYNDYESNFISSRFDELSKKMHLGYFRTHNFNVDYFVKINSFLLQDLFELNNDLYLSRNTYNYKHRSFSYVGYGFGSHVVYSDRSYPERQKKCAECFDKLNKINKSKSELSSNELLSLSAQVFTALDHAHIFAFANGATIKLLLNSFALNNNFEFQWNKLNNDPVDQELFCVARDREVNAISISLNTSLCKSKELELAEKNNKFYKNGIPLNSFIQSACFRLSCLQRTKPVDKTEIHNERIIRRCR